MTPEREHRRRFFRILNRGRIDDGAVRVVQHPGLAVDDGQDRLPSCVGRAPDAHLHVSHPEDELLGQGIERPADRNRLLVAVERG